MNINKAILVGRLTRDPETRSTQGGQTVTTIGLATSHRWSDKSGQKQEKTEFHTIILWGKLGEIAGQYLTKGQEAYFEGRLQTRAYTGKDGVERRVTEIVAENMQMGSRPMGQGGGSASNGGYREGNSGGAPSRSGSVSRAGAPVSPLEEDIPTINLDDDKEEIKIEDVPF
ncbi:MAG: single-stranded DNA-binding protein [Candidatus Moraniibacteriota bacterium]|nr:MAG: single-stranded DNA-binding protein [Candidatus Moranbacteria bacterium]